MVYKKIIPALSDAKLKSFRLIVLRKEISKQPSIDSVLWITLRKSVLIKCSNLRKKTKCMGQV